MRRHFERKTALRTAAFASLLLLAACQSVEDVRSYPPIRAGDFTGSYKNASACAVDGLTGKHAMTISQVVREDLKTAVILGAPDTQIVHYEGRLTEIGANRFRAEVRSAKGILGAEGWGGAADLWKAIESCATRVS